MDGPVLGPRVMVALAERAARHAPAHSAFLSRHPRRGAALMSAFGPLISADWLHAHIGDPDVRVIDFRWYLVGRQGAEQYANGHIPGAAFVELDDVTGKGPGRHPLPTLEQFQAAMRVAGVDDATAVIDSRAGERYRGEKEPVDPKAGHIPGARNAPFMGNLQEDGRFKPREELRRRFEEVGVDPEEGAVVYCGSGVNACHNLLAMELAGVKNVRLYEGSWSDWSSRDAPVATGAEP